MDTTKNDLAEKNAAVNKYHMLGSKILCLGQILSQQLRD